MKPSVSQLKVGHYHVIPETTGKFRVVHTWTGVAVGTYATAPEAIRAARMASEEDFLYRTLGKEDALRVIQRRKGFGADYI